MMRWQLQDAKARFSEVVNSARKAPQEITVRGEPAAVVVSTGEFGRLRKKPQSFVNFIRNSPLAGADLLMERDRTPARSLKLK